jgi:hypothetical protein
MPGTGTGDDDDRRVSVVHYSSLIITGSAEELIALANSTGDYGLKEAIFAALPPPAEKPGGIQPE